ncbi:hypothetical protein NDU88_006052 [Pleurodeles waltl]|uniref:Uncharacterized protein n=1 Tax=Pleurodeles waltl TaxID=8319 RepID=A0AAV7SNJ6_PLEWA|nr:hypothetical protein NDU88_006052 [Pleurodeles waltl]
MRPSERRKRATTGRGPMGKLNRHQAVLLLYFCRPWNVSSGLGPVRPQRFRPSRALKVFVAAWAPSEEWAPAATSPAHGTPIPQEAPVGLGHLHSGRLGRPPLPCVTAGPLGYKARPQGRTRQPSPQARGRRSPLDQVAAASIGHLTAQPPEASGRHSGRCHPGLCSSSLRA